MSVSVSDYNSVKEPSKYKAKQFTITSGSGMSASVITYGALITSLIVPDRDGKMADVMLGLKGLDE